MNPEFRGRAIVSLLLLVVLILSFIFKEVFLFTIIAVSIGIFLESYKIILSSYNVIFDKDYLSRLMLVFFIAIMACLLTCSAYLMYTSGKLLFIIIIISIACADTFAYLFGKQFGKHKLAPMISPGKTWEGLSGGIFACVAVYLSAFALGIIDITLSYAFVWGLFISIISVFGDLFESYIKRKYGVKDSSNILGAHGGIFDRFDSYLFSIPTALLLQQLLR